MSKVNARNGLTVDQQVNYWYTYPGGYGRTVLIQGKVFSLTEKRVGLLCIQTNRHTGETRTIDRHVKYEHIKESTLYIKPNY